MFNMKWLNYHQLMHFRTIAHEGGVSKAAKKLLLGQSGLSTQLKQLESSLGHSLFKRHKKGLILTEAGRLSLKYADNINQLGQDLLTVLSSKDLSSTIKHYSIGALDSIPKHLIAKLVKEARRITNCQVLVLEGRGKELIREVSSHQIDIMLSNYPAPVSSTDLYGQSLKRESISIYGTKKYKKLIKNFPNSLHGQPLILPTYHSKARQDLDHFFHSRSIIYEMVSEVQDTSVQKLLVLDGTGLAPLPDFSVKDLLEEKKIIKIGTLDRIFEEFWLISAKKSIVNPITNNLLENFNTLL
jgi:LysR family transcriptional regulator, transcriptional activator of nhaA